MNAHGIEEKLRCFAQLIQNEPTPSAQPENNTHQELDRIAELCGQILTIAQGKQ